MLHEAQWRKSRRSKKEKGCIIIIQTHCILWNALYSSITLHDFLLTLLTVFTFIILSIRVLQLHCVDGCRLVTLLVDRGLSWEKAKIRLEGHPGKHSGFYCSQREVRNRRLYLLATLKEGSSHLFKIARSYLHFAVKFNWLPGHLTCERLQFDIYAVTFCTLGSSSGVFLCFSKAWLWI